MEISFEIRKSVCVVKLSGRIRFDEFSEFKEEFIRYAEQTVNFVFDLGNFDNFEDLFTPIFNCLKHVSDKDGDIRLSNLSENVRMVCEITRAHKIFDIFDDVDSAVMSYQTD